MIDTPVGVNKSVHAVSMSGEPGLSNTWYDFVLIVNTLTASGEWHLYSDQYLAELTKT